MDTKDDFGDQDRDEPSRGDRWENVILAWDEFASDPTAASAGVVFEELSRSVTAAIVGRDLARAESLTAKAFLMIADLS